MAERDELSNMRFAVAMLFFIVLTVILIYGLRLNDLNRRMERLEPTTTTTIRVNCAAPGVVCQREAS